MYPNASKAMSCVMNQQYVASISGTNALLDLTC